MVANYHINERDKRIIKTITISAPLLGTEIASAFPKNSPVYHALHRPNEKLCLTASKALHFNNLYHIVPTWDHLIIPITSAYYFTTPKENIYYYTGFWYSHSGICYNYDIANRIANWIQR